MVKRPENVPSPALCYTPNEESGKVGVRTIFKKVNATHYVAIASH